MLMMLLHEFPSSGWMFASPPFPRRASAFLGFWVRSAPHGTPRIGAVVEQPATPRRVAPRVDHVDGVDPRASRQTIRALSIAVRRPMLSACSL